MSFPLRTDPGTESEPIPELFSGSRHAQKSSESSDPDPQSNNLNEKPTEYIDS
jgi:hypothetical protein